MAMKQNTDGVKLLERDISIEEFDAFVFHSACSGSNSFRQ
jgi:hypothetical protein